MYNVDYHLERETGCRKMTSGWVKSLQCKSTAIDDVVHYHLLPTSSSCRKSVQSLKDVVDTKKTKPKRPKLSPAANSRHPVSRKSEPGLSNPTTPRPRSSTSSAARTSQSQSRAAADPYFPALTELPEGHPSRNVVEIIFHTSWSPKAFAGRIEMVFKVQNMPRTVTRFEEYREVVKTRAGSGSDLDVDGLLEDHARCVADGNEVMRFHCLGPTGVGAYDTVGGSWAFHGGKGAAMCTYSGSGGAHESAGGGRGRKAMLVCRVIAGRVCKRLECDSFMDGRVGFDSVSGDNGELLVFDSRAVLPCFLVFYKL